MLASVGIYGVMSYSVTQRTHEICIRMAPSVKASDVLKLVLGQRVRVALMGAGIDVAGALAVTHLPSRLFGVSATDPLTFVVAFAGDGGIAGVLHSGAAGGEGGPEGGAPV